jgi:hypothetical protein
MAHKEMQGDTWTELVPEDRPEVVKEKFRRYFAAEKKWNIVALFHRLIFDLDYSLNDSLDWDKVAVTAIISEDALLRLPLEGERPEPWEWYEGWESHARRMVLTGELRRAAGILVQFPIEVESCNVIIVTSEHLTDCEKPLNNCFFKTENTVKHDELNFRSKAEITIYEELKKRSLLFFPNAAVLGGNKSEKREPDFLICNQGKWGILEVMGDAWHTNASKDHDRARLFKDHGVLCMEFFNATECTAKPAVVVDRFLGILAQH